MDFQHPLDDQVCAGVMPALRAALQRIETFLNSDSEDDRHRPQACDELRCVRGALLMLQAESCAAVVGEMEAALRAAPETAMAEALRDGLLRAFQEVRACIDPVDARLRPLTDLDHMTHELKALCAHDDAVEEIPAAAIAVPDAVVVPMDEMPPGSPTVEADAAEPEAVYVCGEWEPGDAAWIPEVMERDTPMTQIKVPLMAVVQALPQWWDDMLNPVLLQTLDQAFGDIEARAGEAGLREIADLALTLRRLVAKLNDEMLPMTLQMMYGVVEQGVLKLGILLREGGRSGPQVAGAATLVKAFSDLKQLTHQVAAMDEEPVAVMASEEHEALQHGAPAAEGLDRLEDLLIEANLLHSQLLPRVNMMKRQQRHIQAELAALRRGGMTEGEYGDAPPDDAPSGTFAGMLRAQGALTKLITECEACLQRYRSAAHELQQAILADAGAGWRQAASH